MQLFGLKVHYNSSHSSGTGYDVIEHQLPKV
jgi:hypothetical protein